MLCGPTFGTPISSTQATDPPPAPIDDTPTTGMITGKSPMCSEVLVRARAVENLAYVIAVAQGGYHLNGRETYGDSLIVNPWGEILDRLARGSGVVLADIDRRFFDATRTRFPSIQHRKLRA